MNTNPAHGGRRIRARRDASLLELRRQRERVRLERDQLELRARKSELVDHQRVADVIFRLAFEDRRALENWAATGAVQVAAALGIEDVRRVQLVLGEAVRRFLERRANVAARWPTPFAAEQDATAASSDGE